jgi:hypothetical protein
MSVSLRGHQQWEGFHVLCKAPEVAGLDRRVFGLLGIVFFVMWQLMASFLLGVALAVGCYLFFRRIAAADPHWFELLRVTSRYDVAWCDPGGVPARFGPCVVDDRLDARSSDRASDAPDSPDGEESR